MKIYGLLIRTHKVRLEWWCNSVILAFKSPGKRNVSLRPAWATQRASREKKIKPIPFLLFKTFLTHASKDQIFSEQRGSVRVNQAPHSCCFPGPLQFLIWDWSKSHCVETTLTKLITYDQWLFWRWTFGSIKLIFVYMVNRWFYNKEKLSKVRHIHLIVLPQLLGEEKSWKTSSLRIVLNKQIWIHTEKALYLAKLLITTTILTISL